MSEAIKQLPQPGGGSDERLEDSAKWVPLQHVMVPMVVKVPLPKMTLRMLSQLGVGALLESEWPAAEEVPLFASEVTLSWCEFAVMNEKIGARLTRLG